MDAELKDIVAQVQLRRLVEDYAGAADRQDQAGFAGVFTHDGILEVRQQGYVEPLVHAEGPEELGAVMLLFNPFLFTQHLVCNHRVTLDADGRTGTGETYCLANHVSDAEGGRQNLMQFIRYLDRYVRTDDGWRFTRRDNLVRWQQIVPVTTAPLVLDPANPPTPTRLDEDFWPVGPGV
jgi:hypothetical protein